jgi:hypothetical protein
MRSLAFVLFCFWLFGCSYASEYGEQYVVHIDPKFDSPHIEKINEGLIQWEIATNVILRPVIEDSDCSKCDVESSKCEGNTDFNICIHSSTVVFVERESPDSSGPIGLTVGRGTPHANSNIYIASDSTHFYNFDGNELVRGLFLQTVLHEVGHSLGLIHSSNKSDVMWPIAGNRDISCGDVFQYALLRGLVIPCKQ